MTPTKPRDTSRAYLSLRQMLAVQAMAARGCLPVGFLALVLTGRAFAADQPARIVGGADAFGNTYTWQVHNNGPSPIVEVRIPHYRAVLFYPPQGWSSDCTALVHEGAGNDPGVCTARVEAPADGIAAGRSCSFSMQVAPGGAKKGSGQVTVKFADASETRVAGVELPQREEAGDMYLPLLGLGGVFAVFVIAQAVRKLRRGASQSDGWKAEGTESH